MSNYLKKILFSLLILLTPYMNSVSNANHEEDCDKSIIRARQVSFVKEDQQDIVPSLKPSTPAMGVTLEDPNVSWTSYLFSDCKKIAQGAFDVLDGITRNPTKAAIVGLAVFSYQIMPAAAGCACYCFNSKPVFYGICSDNMAGCTSSCAGLGFPAVYCMDKDKGC